MLDRPRRIRKNVSVQHVVAEMLVYDGERHLAFCLNATSAAVWKLADGTRSIAQMQAALSSDLGLEISAEVVGFAVITLRADGLIEPCPTPTAHDSTSPAISRRSLLRRLGVGGAMLLPAVASIVAPTAAQAYNGCVDCTTSNSRAARIRRLQQSSQQ